MNNLIKILYEYAQKNRAPAFLVGGEYENVSGIVDRQEKRIAALLPPGGAQAWSNFQGDSELLQAMELEAMFRAGLSIGLELAGL